MPRCPFRVALRVILVVFLLAAPAAASVTIDLIWERTGNRTLSVAFIDPGDLACAGFHFNAPGYCMKIVWRVGADGLYRGSNSVQWTDSGMEAVHAAFFPRFMAIPVGKSAWFGPFHGNEPNKPGCRSPQSQNCFRGAVVPIQSPSTTNFLPAGTYTVGTIVFDAAFSLFNTFELYLLGGIDDFLDSTNSSTSVSLGTATFQTLSDPFVAVPVLHPVSAGILALGIAVVALVRRRLR